MKNPTHLLAHHRKMRRIVVALLGPLLLLAVGTIHCQDAENLDDLIVNVFGPPKTNPAHPPAGQPGLPGGQPGGLPHGTPQPQYPPLQQPQPQHPQQPPPQSHNPRPVQGFNVSVLHDVCAASVCGGILIARWSQ